eukprot:TRINITY_DN5543_c0_g1_i2.p1 TRINITY_DN5543_c0_g1~~TRINITY_DN5543_c0_g1_i2.p1  ORF type:complete len:696 (+),score=62.75 TRINITY_DN5543_c0_g1_i2:136-2223(+)
MSVVVDRFWVLIAAILLHYFIGGGGGGGVQAKLCTSPPLHYPTVVSFSQFKLAWDDIRTQLSHLPGTCDAEIIFAPGGPIYQTEKLVPIQFCVRISVGGSFRRTWHLNAPGSSLPFDLSGPDHKHCSVTGIDFVDKIIANSSDLNGTWSNLPVISMENTAQLPSEDPINATLHIENSSFRNISVADLGAASATPYGSVVSMLSMSSLTMTNVEFSDVQSNSADACSAVMMENGIHEFVKVHFNNITCVGGIKKGAAVMWNTPQLSTSVITYSLDVSHSSFKDCSTEIASASSSTGGAITAVLPNFADMVIRDSVFERCRAGDGGAIYTEDVGRLKILNSDFISNHAGDRGGAVGARCSTCASVETMSVLVNNSRFDGNTVGNEPSLTAGEARQGGAMWIHDATSFDIMFSEFKNNRNDDRGGLSGFQMGGAIYERCTQQCTFNIVGSTFSNNHMFTDVNDTVTTTSLSGAAVSAVGNAADQTLVVTHSTFIDNTVDIDEAANRGFIGGILYTTNNVILTDSIFENNTCTSTVDGGISSLGCGFAQFLGDQTTIGTVEYVVVERTVFRANKGLAGDAAFAAGVHGVGMLVSALTSLNVTDCWFDQNYGQNAFGAGAFFSGYTMAEIVRCSFTNNVMEEGLGHDIALKGGALLVNSPGISIDSCTFANNRCGREVFPGETQFDHCACAYIRHARWPD